MKLADRILELRKQKGISQEALADQLEVSRQAISKWESEQSTPELDKIILMSDFFEVSTDYLLKGIEPVEKEGEAGKHIGNALSLLAPWMVWIGFITSCAFWYEYANAFAAMDAFIWIVGSIVIIYVCRMNRLIDQKAVYRYWMISIPAISLFVLSILYNVLAARSLAPYPQIYGNGYPLLVVWLLFVISLNIAVGRNVIKVLLSTAEDAKKKRYARGSRKRIGTIPGWLRSWQNYRRTEKNVMRSGLPMLISLWPVLWIRTYIRAGVLIWQGGLRGLMQR